MISRIAVAVLMLSLTSLAPAQQQSPVAPIPPPAEPGALALNTGGVKDSVAPESWFRQDGKPFARAG